MDDIDSTYEDTDFFRRKVSTFFSACRKLSRDVKGLNIRTSVRTDVWSCIRTNEDLDKAEQYILDIKWTKPEMGNMLAKRIFAYIQRDFPQTKLAQSEFEQHKIDALIELAFVRRIPWGTKKVPPLQIINILSAKRPRWMAQLCRLAGENAIHSTGGKRISGTDVTSSMRKFGELRLADLYKEHLHQFSMLRPLIESFASGPRKYETQQLLNRIDEKFFLTRTDKSMELDGKAVKTSLELAHFLYRIGFLQGQSKNKNVDDFVDYDHRPDLLTEDINLDDNLCWAIYPSYRNVLRIS